MNLRAESTRRPSSAQDTEELFAFENQKSHRLVKIQRRFVDALVVFGEENEVGRALRKLQLAAKQRSPNQKYFHTRLLYRLATCWEAYRWEKSFKVTHGLSERRLESFPERLEAIAEDIQRVNASYYGSPVAQLREKSGSFRRFPGIKRDLKNEAGSYYDLPRVLSGYAERVRHPPRLLRRRLGRDNLARDAEMSLVTFVKNATRRDHLPQVTALLLATCCLAGERRFPDLQEQRADVLLRKFNAKSFAARVSRYRKREKVPVHFSYFRAMLILVHSLDPRLKRNR